MTEAAGATGAASGLVLQAASRLAHRAADMRNSVDGFLADVRA